MDQIIFLARKNGIYIFSDEVYRYLEINKEDILPSISDLYENGISLNVMTKAFGLGGLRIGFIATQNKQVLDKMLSYKLYTSICNSGKNFLYFFFFFVFYFLFLFKYFFFFHFFFFFFFFI